MDYTERIKFEEYIGDKYKTRIVEPNLDKKEAILTHFLQNKELGIADIYKQEAVEFAKDILTNKYPHENITSELAENALEYGMFDVDIPFPQTSKPAFRFIDLFAGVGGFRIALQNLKGKCIFSSEWDKKAQCTYRANFGETPFGDITRNDIKFYIPQKIDILCAGFPCQAFSIAGKQKGFSETRGTLFFDVEQIIAKHRPKVVFLENVKNLISHDKGKTFRVILEILQEKLGYKVFYKVMNTMNYANIPQNRERIFIVCFDPSQIEDSESFRFPTEIELSKNIHDILDSERQEEKYYYPKSHIYYPKLVESITTKDTIYQWRRIYVRENKNNVCPTLTANMGTGGHNVPLIKDDYGIRKLTPRECFKFQGYPMDKFILPPIADSKLYMQAGNSVTTTLIERIGKEIIKLL